MTLYLAAPLSAPTPALRRWHRDRAILAGELLGATTIPHRDIAPRYCLAYPDEDETPEQRVAAMEECLRGVAKSDRLSVLLRDDHTHSPGCEVEIAWWGNFGGRVYHVYTWALLRRRAVDAGRLPEWSALANPPDDR